MTFSYIGSLPLVFCISMNMSKYAYQIQGALENAQGQFKGLRILVCDLNNFDSVDVPVEVGFAGAVVHEEARMMAYALAWAHHGRHVGED